MTEKEKKQEEKVFEQEVSHDELKSVSGGESCGKPSLAGGACPNGANVKPVCPFSMNSGTPGEVPGPGISDPPFTEVEIKDGEDE